jgi:hypothetical protein
MATLQPETPNETKLEVWTVIVLGLVSLVTAWAAFQSSLWNGVAIEEFARADAQRTAGASAAETGAGTYQEDRALFLEYYKATRGNDATLANYIKRELMPKRLRDATEAWEKSPNNRESSPFRPAFGYEAPGGDFEKVGETLRRGMAAARNASSLGDRYNLAAVLFAASLFLAGISSTLRFVRFRTSLLIIGTLIFIGTAAWMFTLDVRNPV